MRALTGCSGVGGARTWLGSEVGRGCGMGFGGSGRESWGEGKQSVHVSVVCRMPSMPSGGATKAIKASTNIRGLACEKWVRAS